MFASMPDPPLRFVRKRADNQISDTHLGYGKAHFADNWALLARRIVEQCPNLVIHTGRHCGWRRSEEDMRLVPS